MASVDLALSFLPESLRILLDYIITSKDSQIKTAPIGQAIIQSARPRILIAPLQLGPWVQLHNHFGSRFLIDTLNSHGFCCSYREVSRFERCAAASQGTEIPNLSEGCFVQYVADNVDHNTCTLDGFSTFHGMGMMTTVMPSTTNRKRIHGISVSSEDIAAVGKINIEYFTSGSAGMKPLHSEHLDSFVSEVPTHHVGVLYKIAIP